MPPGIPLDVIKRVVIDAKSSALGSGSGVVVSVNDEDSSIFHGPGKFVTQLEMQCSAVPGATVLASGVLENPGEPRAGAKRGRKSVFVHRSAMARLPLQLLQLPDGKISVVFAPPDDYLDPGGPDSKNRLRPTEVRVLKLWTLENWHSPYPNDEVKKHLADTCGLSLRQAGDWFRNERKRLWLPMRRRAESAIPDLVSIALAAGHSLSIFETAAMEA